MSRITILGLIVLSFSLAACSDLLGNAFPGPAKPSPLPWEPAPGDNRLSRGEVFISEEELRTQESDPAQYTLFISGTLPTPCHQLRATISDPDENNQILVEVYSVVDPAEICIQVLEPFEATIPLGSYTTGKYTVLVNEQLVGEIVP